MFNLKREDLVLTCSRCPRVAKPVISLNHSWIKTPPTHLHRLFLRRRARPPLSSSCLSNIWLVLVLKKMSCYLRTLKKKNVLSFLKAPKTKTWHMQRSSNTNSRHIFADSSGSLPQVGEILPTHSCLMTDVVNMWCWMMEVICHASVTNLPSGQYAVLWSTVWRDSTGQMDD